MAPNNIAAPTTPDPHSLQKQSHTPVLSASNEFDGMTILVTGSTRGIGRAIAAQLINAGACVGIHGRDPQATSRAAAELGPENRAIPIACDLTDPANAEKLVADFHTRTGRIDALVNNAGAGKAAAFRALTLQQWRQTFALNVEAALLASRAAYLLMRKTGQGAIVNIASLAAHGPGKWMGADYAASKAALVSLTRSLAFEAARFHIRVNAVSPGFIETDMTACLTPEHRAALQIPLGRLGLASDVAQAVSFLLSQSAAYITGETLHVDGGLWM